MSVSASSYLCSLSGTVPTDPVVARSTGLLFERRLVERALELNGGVCPRTGTPLSKDDLISVKSSVAPGVGNGVSASEVVRPRPPSATSIPGLLALMQSEWDAIVLESHQLKQALESTKQDLAHALYKEDAANRVIARLLKERDQARQALLQTEQNLSAAINAAPNAAAPAAAPMEVDDDKKAAAPAAVANELPEPVLSAMAATAAALSKGRKAAVKEAAAAAATPADLQQMKVQDKSHPLHATTNPGILSVDLSRANPDLILTGGNDGQAILFNRSTGKIASHIKGHKSAVSAVKFHPTRDLLFTASLDQTANIWSNDGTGKYVVAHHLAGARDAVTGIAVHASGDYAATGSKDGSWALYDVNGGSELKRMAGSVALSTVNFHPDGLILAAGGVDGQIRLFDLKSWKLATSLAGQHTGPISSFAFAENGFQCASAEQSGVIKLWDLRKLTNYHTIVSTGVDGDKAGSAVSSIAFDDSASYLAAATGSRCVVYAAKTFDEVINLYEHKDRVTGVAWGSQARTLVTVSVDRNLKVWA